MFKQLKVAEFKCVDDSEGTRGIHITCGDNGRSTVSLFFDKRISHKQTDDLVHLLKQMNLTSVIIENA